MKTENMIVGILEKKHLTALLNKDRRIDNRDFFSPREFIVENNVINIFNLFC